MQYATKVSTYSCTRGWELAHYETLVVDCDLDHNIQSIAIILLFEYCDF